MAYVDPKKREEEEHKAEQYARNARIAALSHNLYVDAVNTIKNGVAAEDMSIALDRASRAIADCYGLDGER